MTFTNVTRGPMGHILDKGIRCFKAIRVQLPNKGKFAKLRPCCQSLEKHLHFPREHFLIIMTGVQCEGFLPGAVQQLKLLPRGNTSHFLHPKVVVSPYFNGP